MHVGMQPMLTVTNVFVTTRSRMQTMSAPFDGEIKWIGLQLLVELCFSNNPLRHAVTIGVMPIQIIGFV